MPPSRMASTLASQAIKSEAATAERSIEDDLDDLLGDDGAAAGSSATKRKRNGTLASNGPSQKTPVRSATKVSSSAAAKAKQELSESEHEPSSARSSSSEDDLSSAPPSPKPRAKRARQTPGKAAAPASVSSIAADFPYEYDTSTKKAPSTPAGIVGDEAAAKTPAKSKRTPAPRKKKEPSPEFTDEGATVTAEDEDKPQPKKRKGGGRKKVKEVVIHDVPVVEQLPTTFKGRLGYACLNSLLRTQDPEVFCSRTLRLAGFLSEEGHNKLVEITNQNTADLLTILKWNAANEIYLFRLSSEMFPFASHKEHGYRLSSLPQAYANLQEAGRFAKEHNMRITVHPGQWTQLASPREVVVENAILELEYQCEMLEAMGVGNEGVMVIHMGGVFGNKEETLNRFRENYRTKVPERIKNRLVLENDDVCYTVDDLLPVCRDLEIPLVFDYHHDWVNPSSLPAPLLMPQILDTWKVRGGVRVKQHLSEPRKGAVTIMEKRGHADRCKSLPLSLAEGTAIAEREMAEKAAAERAGGAMAVDGEQAKREPSAEPQVGDKIVVVGEDGKEVEERVIPEFGIRMGLPDDVDLMIEAKDKEQAVLHLYNLYGLGPVHRGSYLPPKPEPEFPDSSDSGEDEGAVEVDEHGNAVPRSAKKEGKKLTPMAKAKRAKAAAKLLAQQERRERLAAKKIADEEQKVAKAAERAAKAAAKQAEKEAKAAAPKPARRTKKDLARAEAELEKEVELDEELMKMDRAGKDGGGLVADLERIESELSDIEDKKASKGAAK